MKRRPGQPEPVGTILVRVLLRGFWSGRSDRRLTPHEELAALEAASAPLCVACQASFRASGWRVCASCLDDFRDAVEASEGAA